MERSRLTRSVPRLLLAACLLIGAAEVGAEVYRWVDGQGNVIFSDTPHEGAELIQLGPTTIVPSERVRSAADPLDETVLPAPPVFAYASVSVAAPADDATLRDQQNIAVDVASVPPLQTTFGHKVQLYVDGAAFGAPTATPHFSLPTVDRGTHQLAAAIIDASGKELIRSATSVFHLHKTSVANRQNGTPRQPKAP